MAGSPRCGSVIAVVNGQMNRVDYGLALAQMAKIADMIKDKNLKDVFWLLEHEGVYTAGRSWDAGDVLDPDVRPVEVYRGGKITYHGEGQKVLYVMMDLLRKYGDSWDIREYIAKIEEGAIRFLKNFDVVGERRDGKIGVWVKLPHEASFKGSFGGSFGKRDALSGSFENDGFCWGKIASVGVGVRRGVTMHGCSINVAPNLAMFDKIVPCGIKDMTNCSLESLGRLKEEHTEKTVNRWLIEAFVEAFEFDSVSELGSVEELLGR